jgi:phage terminase large subunit-like protein
VSTHAPTEANRAHLAASFLDEVQARFGGTRKGRQELMGELVEDVEGALWTSEMLERRRLDHLPAFDRVVVAVDPAVGGADECGIVVVGAVTKGPPQHWKAVVLEDASVARGAPEVWARAALAAMERHKADRLIAEANQGGKLVESLIRNIDALVPLRLVHAAVGKGARAEPVAGLYEQGRVGHVRGLHALEEQMCRMTAQGYLGPGSPDRLDALVWALNELILEPSRGWRAPQVRGL